MDIIEIEYDKKSLLNDEYVIAIGNFDGLHVAHRLIIEKAASIAKENNLKLGVVSFDITPKKVVNEIDNYYILKSFSQKRAALQEMGVQTLFLLKFDDNMRHLPADEFIEMLLNNIKIKYLVCGFDFAFGKDKKGDVQLLKKHDEFQTIVIEKISNRDAKIGSTLIHELILNGEILKANELLGHPYSIIGTVIYGNQKGRLINFPTANLKPEANYRIPGIGVYATKVIVKGKEYYGMTNIGHNPTFNYCSVPSIETNIFDFCQDIYGETIEVIFLEEIRREKIFSDSDELKNQLEKDKKTIIKLIDEGKI